MDFVFDEDQEALADSVKRLLMTEMTPELIRELGHADRALGRPVGRCSHRRG